MTFANDFDGSFNFKGVATLVVGVDSFFFVKRFSRENYHRSIAIKQL